MKSLLSILLGLGVYLAASPSQALLLEPVLTYETGTVNYQAVLGTNPTVPDKHSGILIGGRVGTDILGLFYTALDYRTGNIDFDIVGSGKREIMGLVVGADLPMVRAWATYNFKDNLEADFGGSNRTIEGTSMALGVGLGMIPFVEIGLEYVSMSKGDENDESFFISLSAPFDL